MYIAAQSKNRVERDKIETENARSKIEAERDLGCRPTL